MSGGLVAVVFTDVVASTELWSSLGHSRADDVRRRLRAASDAAVAGCSGVVVKDLGDGIMATFPTASACIEGAVALQQASMAVARATGVNDLHLRVGASIGEATREGDDWFGVPVVEASRLCDAASAGGILIADSVVLLARSSAHPVRPLGPRPLQGLAEPVAVSEVEWSEPVGSGGRLPAFLRRHRRELPFTGRQHELKRMTAALHDASDEHLVLVSGEPGVGKTRLLSEFAARAVEDGALVLGMTNPEGAPGYARSLARALRVLPEVCEPPDRARPVIATVVPDLLDVSRAPRTSSVDSGQVGDALAAWFNTAAAERPLVFVIDDLHWAPPEWIAVLEHLVDALDEAPVLVVASYRDTDLSRLHPLGSWLADRRRSTAAMRIDLHGLGLDDIVAALSALAEERLDQEVLDLAAEIERETDGNAFFTVQVIEHLGETGALVCEDGRWRVSSGESHVGLPQGVREVVGRRLERLPSGTDDVLAAAAVQGARFSVSTLHAALGGDVDTVVDALAAAEEAALIRSEPGSIDRCTFVHALVRHTILEELPTLRRARLHLRIATALDEARPSPDPETALEIADHYLEAAALGGLPRAVELIDTAVSVTLSADRAVHRAAVRALAAAEEVGLEQHLLVRVHIARAVTAWLVDNDRAATAASFAEAVRLAEDLGDAELFADAVAAGFGASGFGLDPAFLALAPRALEGVDPRSTTGLQLRGAILIAHSLFAAPGIDPPAEFAQLCADLPPEAPRDFSLRGWSFHSSADLDDLLEHWGSADRTALSYLPGFFATVRADLAEAQRTLDGWASTLKRSPAMGLRAAHSQATALLAMAQGRFDDAANFIDRVEREAGDDVMFAVGIPWQRFELARWRGEEAEALRFFAVAVRHPYARHAALARALLDLQLGDRERAEAGFREGWADGPTTIGRDWMYTGTLSLLAELAAGLGLASEAAELQPILQPYDGQFVLEASIQLRGSYSWLLGGLAACQGDVDEAIRCYERAEHFETEQGAVAMAARTRRDLASLRPSAR